MVHYVVSIISSDKDILIQKMTPFSNSFGFYHILVFLSYPGDCIPTVSLLETAQTGQCFILKNQLIFITLALRLVACPLHIFYFFR